MAVDMSKVGCDSQGGAQVGTAEDSVGTQAEGIDVVAEDSGRVAPRLEVWQQTISEYSEDRGYYFVRWFKGTVRAALAQRLPVPVEVTDSLGWKPRAWQKSRAELEVSA